MIDHSRDSTLIICDACEWWFQGVGIDHLQDALDQLEQHQSEAHTQPRSTT